MKSSFASRRGYGKCRSIVENGAAFILPATGQGLFSCETTNQQSSVPKGGVTGYGDNVDLLGNNGGSGCYWRDCWDQCGSVMLSCARNQLPKCYLWKGYLLGGLNRNAGIRQHGTSPSQNESCSSGGSAGTTNYRAVPVFSVTDAP